MLQKKSRAHFFLALTANPCILHLYIWPPCNLPSPCILGYSKMKQAVHTSCILQVDICLWSCPCHSWINLAARFQGEISTLDFYSPKPWDCWSIYALYWTIARRRMVAEWMRRLWSIHADRLNLPNGQAQWLLEVKKRVSLDYQAARNVNVFLLKIFT